jgi:Type II restriction endonuclease EcoO109I
MAATVQELIKKGFSIHSKGLSPTFKLKIDLFSNHFGSVKSFLEAKKEVFDKLVFVIDNPKVNLTDNDFEKIQAFQQSGLLDAHISVQQNFINILTTEFINRQLLMIDNLALETLNVNPILAGALNLNNETDLIRYYAYQSISRSVVTSVGFLVQNLILYSSEFVLDGKDEDLGNQTKWDVVVRKMDDVKTYLEVKSGTNDINKSQIHHYRHEIELIEKEGFKAMIAETYGKRSDKTVSHGLLKQYLPNWEERTLIGKELWTFITNDEEYHHKMIDMLMEASQLILGNDTIIDKIEKRIQPLTMEFQTKYKSYNEFLKSLW